MWPDRVSNPGPLTYESGALPTALRGPAGMDKKIVLLALSPAAHLRKLNSVYGRSDSLPKSFGFAKLYNRFDKRYMLERAVKPINKRHDTACAHNKFLFL